MKQERILLSALFILLLLATRPIFAQDININLNAPRQTIDGAGFCHEGDRQNGNYYILDNRIQQMLDNNMSLFRDMFPNKTWEPSKGTFNYNDDRVLNCIKRLKIMQDNGIKTILGIWDVPNWLVSNPGNNDKRHINNFDDFAWFITSFLLHGKNYNNLKVDYLDINETRTSGINIEMTAQEYITLIQKCNALFATNGIQTKINLGSVLLWDIQYCKDIYNAVKDLPVAGYPSWHTYRGGSTTGSNREPISYWEGWGSWRQSIDRNLWGTETDYDAYYWTRPERLTWQGVEEMAVMYYRNFYVARMSTSAGWFWRTDFPSHNVHIAYMRHFEPGGQVVETSQPSGDVMTVAYKHQAKGKFVIQTVNQSSSARTVTFHGVPNNKPLTLIRTSEAGDRYQTVGTYTPNGTSLTITLQANSFNTFYGELAGGTEPTGNATVYADCPFAGTAVGLAVGDYTQAQLQGMGIANNSISSVRVQSGYKITLYADDNFGGNSLELTADDDCLVDNGFNDLTSSIRVSAYNPNLAYNRPVFTTTNESAAYAGDYAVDASGTTRWASAYANNQSIVVDLGANYSVNRVRLAWEAAYARDYQIQFSVDNTNWTTVREFWGKNSAAADNQTGLTGVARYVKVYCINRATTYGFSLFEFEVYGTLSGGGSAQAMAPATLDLKHPADKQGILAYPSPTRNQLTVELPASWAQGSKLEVLNSEGRVMMSTSMNQSKQVLQVASFPSGWYIIRVVNGDRQLTRKIIKE